MQNLSTTGELMLDDLIYISVNTHEGLLKRSQIKEHDLLIKITGVGRMAIASVAPDGFAGNINQHIVVVRTGSKELSQNLAAFLNLDSVEKIAAKRATGGTRPALDYPALFSIPVINNRDIYLRIQKAVEAKREKEAEAQRSLDSIDDYLLNELGINLPKAEENTLQNRIFYRNLSDISGGRFDPNKYRRERLEAISSIKNSFFPTKTLREIISFRSIKVDKIDGATTYIGMKNIVSNTGELISTNEKETISSASVFFKGDILFPKLRPYLNKVYYTDEDGLCSTEFHVLHSGSECNEFIASFLRSKIVLAQTKYLMSGNTLPRLQLEDIERLFIPTPPLKKQLEIVDRITAIRNQAKQLRKEAEAELEQAKQEVEAMILGD